MVLNFDQRPVGLTFPKKPPTLIREVNLYELPMCMINVKLQPHFASVNMGNFYQLSLYLVDELVDAVQE